MRQTLDVETVRRKTPVVAHVAHVDNAGSSRIPQVVLDAQMPLLHLAALCGGHEAAAMAHDVGAECINADADEMAIIENATSAWNMACDSNGLIACRRALRSTLVTRSRFYDWPGTSARQSTRCLTTRMDSSTSSD